MEGKINTLYALLAMLFIWVILSEPCYAADETLDVDSGSAKDYTTMLERLRKMVTNPNLKYPLSPEKPTNLPVMANPTEERFIKIDLKAKAGTITIAMGNKYLYIKGYADVVNGESRAHFFKDVPEEERKRIFPNAKVVEFPFTSRYESMEGKQGAKQDRKEIKLGKQSLNDFIKLVYGKSPNSKNEAKLMLVVIQMISEAMRFKYIERMVKNNFNSGYKPDPKAISLEPEWQKITCSIKNSKEKKLIPQVKIKHESGKDWIVKTVDAIATEMALLKYEGDNNNVGCDNPLVLSSSI